MKESIAVIFGGKSVEHDISIITGLQTIKNLSKKYEVLPVYIDIKGQWWIAENLDDVKTFLNFTKNVKKKKQVTPILGKPYFSIDGRFKKNIKIDVAVLCTHGKNGEDGSLQGVLEMCGIAYTSCGVLSSAVCMDKAVTKRIMRTYKIQSPKFMDFYASDFDKNKYKLLQEIESGLTMPLIVKPANLGSSVGISICEDMDKITSAIENAFLYDEKVVVEEFITGAKEFACGVMKVNGKAVASEIQEVNKGDIYTFEDKYLVKKEQKQEKVSQKLENRIKKLAIESYKALECDGVVRVDFLFTERNNTLYVNELNTIPGSLAFNLFNTSFRDLLDVLISEAKAKKLAKDKDVYEFNSKAIEVYAKLTNQNKYAK